MGMKGGFEYDEKRDRYFMRREAEWDVEKRIEKGRRQFAVPAKTKEDFLKDEETMVDELLARLKAKAATAGPAPEPAEKDEDKAEDDVALEKPKKKKKEREEAAADDESA